MSKFERISSVYKIQASLVSRIDERSDLIIILLRTLQIILLNKNNENIEASKFYGEILYYNSPKKINRVLYLLNNDKNRIYQAVSMVNPFRLVNRADNHYFKLDLKNNNRDVFYFDFMSLQFYIEIFEAGWIDKKVESKSSYRKGSLPFRNENTLFDMSSFYDYLCDKCAEFSKEYNKITADSLFEDNLWKIIRYLMMFELGYFRYDFDDSDRENEKYHPLHHFDINYSEVGTYKVGINPGEMQENGVVDLITRLVSESKHTEKYYLN